MLENMITSQNIAKEDSIPPSKSIYEASPGEIFWKNFLAGFGRGLGGIFVYLLFLLILYFLFYYFLLPKIMPLVNEFLTIFKTLGNLTNTKPDSGSALPQNLFKILGK